MPIPYEISSDPPRLASAVNLAGVNSRRRWPLASRRGRKTGRSSNDVIAVHPSLDPRILMTRRYRLDGHRALYDDHVYARRVLMEHRRQLVNLSVVVHRVDTDHEHVTGPNHTNGRQVGTLE